MNKFKIHLPNIKIITNIVVAISGLILLIFPKNSLVAVSFISGLVMFLKGVTKIIGGSIITGILSIGLAILLFMHPEALLSVLPFIIGLIIVIYGIRSFKKSKTTTPKILNVLVILGGIIILVAPFGFATAVTSIIGAGLLTVGLVVIISQLTEKNKSKN